MWSSSVMSDDEFEDDRSNRSGASSSYSLDMLMFPWKGEVDVIPTRYGPVNVTVCGNRSKPALVTYHDIGLNHLTCFQGLFACAESNSVLMHNFCVYHVDAPGHELEAKEISIDKPELSAEDLSEQVAEVLSFYGINSVICIGVSAGAYILTLLAIRHPTIVEGLVLISPICQSPTWSEWAFSMVLSNLLGFYGMTRFVKEWLLQRYFCQEQRGFYGPGSEAVRAFRRELEERVPTNVLRYFQAMNMRQDLTHELRKLKCHSLIIVGEKSPFLQESIIMRSHMNPNFTSWIEIEGCGSLITEERPHTIQTPLEYFLMGLGYTRPSPSFSSSSSFNSSLTSSPTSPQILYDLLSPQGLGLKLKPIKTRISSI